MLWCSLRPVQASSWTSIGQGSLSNSTTHSPKYRSSHNENGNITDYLPNVVLGIVRGAQLHYYTILYYTILYYTILYYTILYYTILYYTILYYTILYYTILYYTILYYTILYYTILYYTILYYTILYYTILYYTILYYTIPYYTILCYIMYMLYGAQCKFLGTGSRLLREGTTKPDDASRYPPTWSRNAGI